MKTADEWLALGEPGLPLAPALTGTIVRAIQTDALEHAATLLGNDLVRGVNLVGQSAETKRCVKRLFDEARRVEGGL